MPCGKAMEMGGSRAMQHYSARTGCVARVVFSYMPVLCHSYKDWLLLVMEMLKGMATLLY